MKLKTLLHEFQHPMEQFHRFWLIIWMVLMTLLYLLQIFRYHVWLGAGS